MKTKTQHSAPMDLAQISPELDSLRDSVRFCATAITNREPDLSYTLHLAADRIDLFRVWAPGMISELQQLRQQREALAGALRDACPLLFHIAHGQRRTSVDEAQAQAAFNQARAALASLEGGAK